MKKLINDHDYRYLNEGRVNGETFAFCKKIDDDTFETVMPLSTCKDYLNDVVQVENYKLDDFGPVYKFTHEYQNLFKDGVYLAVSYRDRFSTFNYKSMTSKASEIENALNLIFNENIVYKMKEGLIIRLNPEFVSSTFYISFCSFYIRALLNENFESENRFYKLSEDNKIVMSYGGIYKVVENFTVLQLHSDFKYKSNEKSRVVHNDGFFNMFKAVNYYLKKK